MAPSFWNMFMSYCYIYQGFLLPKEKLHTTSHCHSMWLPVEKTKPLRRPPRCHLVRATPPAPSVSERRSCNKNMFFTPEHFFEFINEPHQNAGDPGHHLSSQVSLRDVTGATIQERPRVKEKGMQNTIN